MAITTLAQLIAAPKQHLTLFKGGTRTVAASIPWTMFDIAGYPPAGTLAIGNTANGVVHTAAITGYPAINTFNATGYISKVSFCGVNAGNNINRLKLYDRLFSAGAYSFNSNVSLTAQPSYAGRVPGGDYKGLEIWLETVTAFTGSQSIAITYLDQDGVSSVTGTIATGVAPTVGRMFRVPLAAGDSGVQRIDVVTSSVSTVGTFNVHVMRPLWHSGTLGNTANTSSMEEIVHDLTKTGLVQIYDTSALVVTQSASSTTTAALDLLIEVADG